MLRTLFIGKIQEFLAPRWTVSVTSLCLTYQYLTWGKGDLLALDTDFMISTVDSL